MSHTSHYSFHNPCGRGRFFISSVFFCTVDENVHGDERVGYSGHGADRCDISCDNGDGRRNISRDDGDKRGGRSVDDDGCVSSSKYTIHYSTRNI